MFTIQLRSKIDPATIKQMLGKHPKPSDFPIVTRDGDLTVFKPNGQRLLTVIRQGISEQAYESSYPFLHRLRNHPSTNRGRYVGGDRSFAKKLDGTKSKTTVAAPVRSAIAGNFDRGARYPYCRQTRFSTERPEEWRQCFPLVREMADIFRREIPDRYAAQESAANRTHPAYVIPDSPFTTLTINNCVAGAYHTDSGDYEPGFGCIVVFRRGHYDGALLGFPAYGCAADLHHRDVILFDAHEVHGNTPFQNTVGVEGEDWERLSVVFYFREKMTECLAPSDELERAKRLGSNLAATDE